MPAQPLEYFLSVQGHRLRVRELTGREALSEPFAFRLRLHLPEDQAVSPEAVKSEATLELDRDGVQRSIVGLITEIVVSESATGAPILDAVLEPRWSLARFKQNIKAFVHKDVVAIVSEVLGELGIAFSLRLGSSYPVRPYTVQMRETDFHFVSRMLEEEGIFYFFDEGGTMILADGASAYDDGGSLPFRHGAGMADTDAVTAFGRRARATAGRVELRDWNLEAPSAPMDVSAAGPTAAGPVYYDFPGEYLDEGAGQRIADRMAGALACEARGYKGRAAAGGIAPGRTIALSGAPAGLSDGSYVVSAVEHDFDVRRDGFEVAFEAFEGDMSFRAPVVHEEPLLPHPFIGHVTGAPGEDIHTDEYGRVKVHFPWDRLQPKDDTCSHWVPVLQDNLAHSVSIPRIGWEVLVHFLEGDPDRPVVVGRVYNAEDPFHFKLPEQKTITALRSLSSPSRDGANIIQFRDLQQDEYISIHAERNQDIVVLNDKTEHIVASESDSIQRDEAIVIGQDEHIEVHAADTTPSVKGDRQFEVAGKRDREAAASDEVTVDGNRTLTIGGGHRRTIGINDDVTTNSLSHSVGGVILEACLTSDNETAGKVNVNAVGGLRLEAAGESKIESAGRGALDVTGAVAFTKAGKTWQTNVATQRITLVGGMYKTKATDRVSLTARQSFDAMSMMGELSAETAIDLEVGSSKVSLAEGQLSFTTKTSVRLELNETAALGAGESSHISPPEEEEQASG